MSVVIAVALLILWGVGLHFFFWPMSAREASDRLRDEREAKRRLYPVGGVQAAPAKPPLRERA